MKIAQQIGGRGAGPNNSNRRTFAIPIVVVAISMALTLGAVSSYLDSPTTRLVAWPHWARYQALQLAYHVPAASQRVRSMPGPVDDQIDV